MIDLNHLAELIKKRNDIDRAIAQLIDRPASTGRIGEYIAARVFGIRLHSSATNRASDGEFQVGPLAGKSVNIKLYACHQGLLDLVQSDRFESHAEYYLVLAGSTVPASTSRGSHAPLVVSSVFLFSVVDLLREITGQTKPVKIGIATSVRKHLWRAAMIYPDQVNQALMLTDEQRAALALFAPSTDPGIIALSGQS